ncbi:hypothetical protein K488DRAFT_76091 [Vararia minispora EC-137]|uniref:Uncharacterized protein n=1 Tax=Vararia minispora EC-137 TaxID=1314806 RepID=A0ACB8QWN7_9AGAM|nr:hypothetical protein K488DRAFT_76091 [Vararia minispora EC-137]
MPGLVSREVQTTLNYLAGTTDGEKPYFYTYEPPAGKPVRNLVTEASPATIHDARGREGDFSLDTNGFAFVNSPTQEKLFEDEQAITTGYYKEVEELLKREAGAKRVVIFDHTIRRPPSEDVPVYKQRGPAEFVHVDQTHKAGIARVHRHLGAEAEHYLKGRSRIINVWRPIGNTVAHHPLAVADFRTIDREKDLVAARLIYEDREGETFSVKHNPNLKWYYLADQTPDEVILIKCWDSDTTKALLTPHTAFKDSTSPADAPQRQSIEVRCLVFDQE